MIYRITKQYTLFNTDLDLSIYVDEQGKVLGIFYTHMVLNNTMRGKEFRKIFLSNTLVQTHPLENKPAKVQADNLQIIRELDEYMNGSRKNFNVEFTLVAGSDFQKAVWAQLLTLDYGKLCSYSDVAKEILHNSYKPATSMNVDSNDVSSSSASAHYARALGSAVGTNPLSILIPCHRVLQKAILWQWSGSIQGPEPASVLNEQALLHAPVGNYGGGQSIKRALLLHECKHFH